jgi:succinyldiaminopimelate transaminase
MSVPLLNDRLVSLNDYPFDRLRALLAGIDPPADRAPIGMQIGEPQHAPPPFVSQILDDNRQGWGRYPPPNGSADLAEAIKGWLDRRFDLPAGLIDGTAHIQPVAGTREALFLAALAALPSQTSSGERPAVLMPNPHYAVYYGAAVLAGAEPVLLPATPENGFQPDISGVDPTILRRTGFAFINSPSNPQGAVATSEKIEAAIRTARAYGFLVAFDECYSEIYVGDPPPGALTVCARLADESGGASVDHVLVFHSLSKRSSAPGLRSGFVAGDGDFIRAFRVLRQYGGPTLPGPIQAVSAALWRDEAHVEENRARYRDKFDGALEILDGRFGAQRPGGGFFLWLDVGDGEAAAKSLWEKAGVRVLPGRYFAQDDGASNPGDPFVRVAIVHDTDTVRDGIGRIAEFMG